MKTLAIISEFNPFHNGHKYLLEKSKEITRADLAITIMSGDFVQRGEVAIIDKFRRANSAMDAGFDLVIEMPTFTTLQAASFFAKNNIKILDKLGIDFLCFGIENISSFEFLNRVNSILENSSETELVIKNYLKKGFSYTQSSYLAIENIFGDTNFLTSNNILALEYIKSIRDIGSKIKYVPIERFRSKNSDLNFKDSNFASSTAIRNSISNSQIENFLPKQSYESIRDFIKTYKKFPKTDSLFNIFRYKILIEKYPFDEILCYEDGIENLFYKNIINAHCYEEFLDLSTSKRFTKSRLKRIILNYILENKNYFNDLELNFIKILQANQKAMKFLSKTKIKKVISKKDINSIGKYDKKIVNSMIDSSNLYNILIGRDINYDLKRKFFLK